jgi:hypothetical protein
MGFVVNSSARGHCSPPATISKGTSSLRGQVVGAAVGSGNPKRGIVGGGPVPSPPSVGTFPVISVGSSVPEGISEAQNLGSCLLP